MVPFQNTHSLEVSLTTLGPVYTAIPCQPVDPGQQCPFCLKDSHTQPEKQRPLSHNGFICPAPSPQTSSSVAHPLPRTHMLLELLAIFFLRVQEKSKFLFWATALFPDSSIPKPLRSKGVLCEKHSLLTPFIVAFPLQETFGVWFHFSIQGNMRQGIWGGGGQFFLGWGSWLQKDASWPFSLLSPRSRPTLPTNLPVVWSFLVYSLREHGGILNWKYWKTLCLVTYAVNFLISTFCHWR